MNCSCQPDANTPRTPDPVEPGQDAIDAGQASILLQLQDVQHRYALTDALMDVNFTLHGSETVALVGPSGCGKSTLMHIIAGLLTPSHGHVANHAMSTGSVFQDARLLPWKRVLENIALGLRARGVSRAARLRRAAALAARMELSVNDYRKFPHELSGGMQSRVALARALAIDPDLLLLDEPFSALDIGLKTEMYRLLREYIDERGCAVLMITHDIMEAVRLADRIVMMAPAPGRIIYMHALPMPRDQRDDAWVYQTAGELMQVSQVRQGFELEPAADLPAASRSQGHACAP